MKNQIRNRSQYLKMISTSSSQLPEAEVVEVGQKPGGELQGEVPAEEADLAKSCSRV